MASDWSRVLDVSHLFAFLGGTAVGAAGTYLADRFTDQRRKGEAKSEERKRYRALRDEMPILFRELRADLDSNQELAIREFVILPDERVIFNHGHPRLEFHESVHPALVNQVARLVEGQFVDIVRSTETTIYRLREPFVRLVQNDTSLAE